MAEPKLYLVPTPIGNLEDMTFRGVRILKEADVILAEDTRVSGKLLKHYGVQGKLRRYHAHNEHKVYEGIIEELNEGLKMALITDAGTPGISDPGFLLVRACLQAGVKVECLPGATAFVPALVNSGLPADRFVFEGFLPHKKGRKTRMQSFDDEFRTMVFYESPHRLVKALTEMAEQFGPARQASVSRELTKIYEETQNGSLVDLITYFAKKPVKGEIVIVVHGKDK